MALLAALPNGERQNDVGKKTDGGVTTWRFDIALEDPTDEKTNEFSYIHLVNDAMKKRDTPSAVEDSGPVDSKLLRIAKELEEKYGSAVKRRRIVHDADYVDLGYGYDTSDSFVDDADAVDDFVPPEMDTEFGGFYINTGDLEYKRSKDTDIDDFEFTKRKKKPKITRQPSHGTPQTLWANKKLKLAKQQVASAKKLKLPVLMRKTSSDSSKGSATLTPVMKGERKKRPKSDKEGGVKKPRQRPQQSLLAKLEAVAPSNSDQPCSNIDGSSPVHVSQLKETSTSPPLVDSQLNLDGLRVDDVGGSVEVFGSPVAVGGDVGAQQGGVVKGPPPPLPPGVPADLTKMIEDLTSAVIRETSGDKKMNQKTRLGFDAQLMEVEKVASKFVNSKIRVGINDHLAAVFGVSRSSLTSRTRKLIRKKDEDKMTIAMDKLKQAVDERMKVQMKRYEEEVAAAASAGGAGTSDGPASSAGGGSGGSESEVMDTDTVEKSVGPLPVVLGDEESQGGSVPQAPGGGGGGQQAQQRAKKIRKHFKWDVEVKQLLVTVVKVKLEREQVTLQKSINVEAMLMQFLEESVKPLWPKGWMFKGILMRASEPAYKHLLQKDTVPKPIAQLQVSTGAESSSPSVNVAQPPEISTQVPKTIAQQTKVPPTVPQPTSVVQDPKVVAQLNTVAMATPLSKAQSTQLPQSLQPPSVKVGQGTPPEQQKGSRSSPLSQVVASASPTAPVKAVSPTIVLPGGLKLDLSPSINWAKLVAQPQNSSPSLAAPLATATVVPRRSAPTTPGTPGTQAQPVIVHSVKSKSKSPPQQVGGAPAQQVGGVSKQQVGGTSTQQVGVALARQVGVAPARQVGGAPVQQVGGAPAQQVGGAPAQQVGRVLGQQVGVAPAQQLGGAPAQQVGGAPAQQVAGVPGQQVGVAPMQKDNAPVQPRKLTPLLITGGAPMRGAATQRQRMTPTQKVGGAAAQQVGGAPAQQVGGAPTQQMGGALAQQVGGALTQQMGGALPQQVGGAPTQQVIATQERLVKSTSNLDLVVEKLGILKALSPPASSGSLVLRSDDTPSTALRSTRGTTISQFSALHPTANTSGSVSIATSIPTSPMATQIMAEHSYQGSPTTSLAATPTAEGVSTGARVMEPSPSTVRPITSPPQSHSPAPQNPSS